MLLWKKTQNKLRTAQSRRWRRLSVGRENFRNHREGIQKIPQYRKIPYGDSLVSLQVSGNKKLEIEGGITILH